MALPSPIPSQACEGGKKGSPAGIFSTEFGQPLSRWLTPAWGLASYTPEARSLLSTSSTLPSLAAWPLAHTRTYCASALLGNGLPSL